MPADNSKKSNQHAQFNRMVNMGAHASRLLQHMHAPKHVMTLPKMTSHPYSQPEEITLPAMHAQAPVQPEAEEIPGGVPDGKFHPIADPNPRHGSGDAIESSAVQPLDLVAGGMGGAALLGHAANAIEGAAGRAAASAATQQAARRTMLKAISDSMYEQGAKGRVAKGVKELSEVAAKMPSHAEEGASIIGDIGGDLEGSKGFDFLNKSNKLAAPMKMDVAAPEAATGVYTPKSAQLPGLADRAAELLRGLTQ